MTVELRPATEADLPFVTALERRPDHLEAIGQWSDAEHLAAIRREGLREHWIIEREGRPAGYLIAIDERRANGGIYLKRILVAEKGDGTGRAAMRRFIERAFGEVDAGFVWLNVRTENLRAQQLYASLGFRRVPPPDGAFENPQRAFSMRLDRAGWRG